MDVFLLVFNDGLSGFHPCKTFKVLRILANTIQLNLIKTSQDDSAIAELDSAPYCPEPVYCCI